MDIAACYDDSVIVDFAIAWDMSNIATENLESLVHEVLHELTVVSVGNHDLLDFLDVTDLSKVIFIHLLPLVEMTLHDLTLFFLRKSLVGAWAFLCFWWGKWNLLGIYGDY